MPEKKPLLSKNTTSRLIWQKNWQWLNVPTMSSREIATLCDKRHSDVKRDIEVLTEQLDVDVRKFAHIYLDSMNRQQTEYLLDKDTCLCLVAGYNAKLRMAIIKRWQELEQANTPTDPLLMIAHMAQQAVLILMKLVYIKCISATQVVQNK